MKVVFDEKVFDEIDHFHPNFNESEPNRFLATTLWICTEQNVTVSVPAREGRRSRARTMSSTMPQIFLLVESTLNERTKREDCGVWLKGVLVEQNGKVRDVGVCTEVIRDVRDMVAGFLENDCMEPTAGSRDNIGRISARWAWIPL